MQNLDSSTSSGGKTEPMPPIITGRGQTLIALFLIAAGLAACTTAVPPSDSAQPYYEITTANVGDDVSIVSEQGTAFVDVRSERGIGETNITLSRGSWPTAMTLRFYLAGLEGMQLDYGSTKVALSINTSGQILQSATTADNGEISTEPASPYWMNVSYIDAQELPVARAVHDGAILVTLPPDFFSSSPETFNLNWIDFYR
jgi:hypothetical protein